MTEKTNVIFRSNGNKKVREYPVIFRNGSYMVKTPFGRRFLHNNSFRCQFIYLPGGGYQLGSLIVKAGSRIAEGGL